MSQEDSLIDSIAKHIDLYFDMHDGHLPDSGIYKAIIQAVEKVLILKTLERVKFNRVKAARILGINRNTLSKKIEEYKILETS